MGALTMSQIAEQAGIGRATLYRYYPDLQAVLAAWHEEHLRVHLAELMRGAEAASTAEERIESALNAYALMALSYETSDAAVGLHRGDHAVAVQHELVAFLTALLVDGVAEGAVRDDIPPSEFGARLSRRARSGSSSAFKGRGTAPRDRDP